jgi:hypothetical protein
MIHGGAPELDDRVTDGTFYAGCFPELRWDLNVVLNSADAEFRRPKVDNLIEAIAGLERNVEKSGLVEAGPLKGHPRQSEIPKYSVAQVAVAKSNAVPPPI